MILCRIQLKPTLELETVGLRAPSRNTAVFRLGLSATYGGPFLLFRP